MAFLWWVPEVAKTDAGEEESWAPGMWRAAGGRPEGYLCGNLGILFTVF